MLNSLESFRIQNVFFYYSVPIFEGVMRMDYFEHYLCLWSAVSILSYDTIINAEIEIADKLLHKFVREF